jgi:hypothetical protein
MVGAVDINIRKPNYGLEPLPDVDFNIRAGNTLVGFASEDDFRNAVHEKEPLFAKEIIPKFEDEFVITAKAFKNFQDSQLLTDKGEDTHKKAKVELQKRLDNLNEKLNEYLASTYGIDKERQKKKYTEWLESHQPFHWVAEFYEIINGNGGFDVVIGNPPYVATRKFDYKIIGPYSTINCGDLFGITMDRSFQLINQLSTFGMIVPLSGTSTKKMSELTKLIFEQGKSWISYYSASDQPSSLFNGVRHRLMIPIIKINKKQTSYSTNFLKWFSDERLCLFNNRIVYYPYLSNCNYSKNCKISLEKELSILNELFKDRDLGIYFRRHGNTVYYHDAPVHWGKVFDFIPKYVEGGIQKQSSHLKEIYFDSEEYAKLVICYLNSSIFYWYNWQYTNCRDLTKGNIEIVRFDFKNISNIHNSRLFSLCSELMTDLRKNSKIYSRVSKTILTEFDSFYPAKSKPIIDQIDTVLAQHYNFTEEELDFIINYDIKYRMGKELDAYIEGAPCKENIKTRE